MHWRIPYHLHTPITLERAPKPLSPSSFYICITLFKREGKGRRRILYRRHENIGEVEWGIVRCLICEAFLHSLPDSSARPPFIAATHGQSFDLVHFHLIINPFSKINPQKTGLYSFIKPCKLQICPPMSTYPPPSFSNSS